MTALVKGQGKTRREFSDGEVRFGDNLPLLRKIKSESVRLIYIDPPFNTGKRQSRKRIKTVRVNGGNGDESVLAVSAIKRKPSVNPAMMIPMRTILVFASAP